MLSKAPQSLNVRNVAKGSVVKDPAVRYKSDAVMSFFKIMSLMQRYFRVGFVVTRSKRTLNNDFQVKNGVSPIVSLVSPSKNSNSCVSISYICDSAIASLSLGLQS